jgi:hypothetical protein
MLSNPNRRRRFLRFLAVGVLGLGSTLGAGLALGPVAPAGAAPAVANKCAQFPHPTMPPSTGTETPYGFPIQMTGVTLASASTANTLASAYYQFNGLTCTEYTHKYQFAPPSYYYYDCVGFTGYTTREADPQAWQSVVDALHIGTGYVPTPLAFEGFFNGLLTTPQAGWQGVPNVQSIQAGDVLAWQPALSNGQPNTQGVGHSVLPLVAPRAIPGSNNQRWEVVVMDSTAGGHGPDDTRKPTDPLSQRNAPITDKQGQVQPSGLGIGTIALDTTPQGAVTGVEWNVGDAPEQIVFGAGHPLGAPSPGPGPIPPPTPVPTPTPSGYAMVAANGNVSSFGDAYNYQPATPLTLKAPVVGITGTTDGNGYWEAASDGGVFSFGVAQFYGSMGGQPLNKPMVGIAATEDQSGYWEAGSDGGIFSFGNATFYGSMGGHPLNQPIVGIAATPGGTGYWEVASDGGIFAFGSAAYYGSMGGTALNKPIVGMAATPDGQGYWLVASDGGVFAFGDANFYGSMGGQPLNAPVVAIAGAPDGGGYWEIGADGGVFAFGSATFQGGLSGGALASPIVGGMEA